MRWISGHFSERDIAPGDRFVHLQRAAFAADPIWNGIFPGELCRAVALIPPYEGIPLEHLLCPVANSETPRPGAFETEVRTYSVLRFEVPRGDAMEPGAPGICTLVDYGRNLLSALGCLVVQVGENEITLADRQEAGQVSYIAQPTSESKVLYSLTIEWTYRVRLEPGTRRLQPLVDAGYYL